MLLEDRIDRFRNALAMRLALVLAALGFAPEARILLTANERFVCPVCRLIRAMRREKVRFSQFCATCVGLFRGVEEAVSACVVCFLQQFRKASLLPPVCFQENWARQKVPIFLKNQSWRN